MFYLEKGNEKVYIKKNDNGFYTMTDFRVKLNDLTSISNVLSNVDENNKEVIYLGMAASIANRLKIDLSITDYDISARDIDSLMMMFSKMIREIAIEINEITVAPFDYTTFIKILKSLVAERLRIFNPSIGNRKEPLSLLLDTGLSMKMIEEVSDKREDFLKGFYLLKMY